jgi:hypothetical protein
MDALQENCTNMEKSSKKRTANYQNTSSKCKWVKLEDAKLVDIEETSIKDKSQILFPFTVGPYFIATVT